MGQRGSNLGLRELSLAAAIICAGINQTFSAGIGGGGGGGAAPDIQTVTPPGVFAVTVEDSIFTRFILDDTFAEGVDELALQAAKDAQLRALYVQQAQQALEAAALKKQSAPTNPSYPGSSAGNPLPLSSVDIVALSQGTSLIILDSGTGVAAYYRPPSGSKPVYVQVQPPAPGYHLGMYTSGTADLSTWGDGVGAAGSVFRSHGYGMTDSAGVLAPGTRSPSVRNVSASGGIVGKVDATRFFDLPANQSVILSGYFNYRSDNMTFGSAPGAAALAVGNAGSLRAETYTFGGDVLWGVGTTYMRGAAAYHFGHINETNQLSGGTGSFGSDGYSVDAKFGNVFALFNTTGSNLTSLPTKAQPKATGGIFVGLDLSGHVGYTDNRTDAFTDSTGMLFGTGQTRFGTVGGRAELFELVSGYGLVWKPYVAGTVDQLFSLSSTLNLPIQAGLPIGDVVSLNPARTFGGAELGLEARGINGWTINGKGFYQASSDTNIVGGSISLKIPFNYKTAATPRY